MKRIIVYGLFGAISLCAAVYLIGAYFSTQIFGEPVKTTCNRRVLSTLFVGHSGITISVEDALYDGGLVVSGQYEVLLRQNKNDQNGVLLLAVDNMNGDPRPPSVTLIDSSTVMVGWQKGRGAQRGPEQHSGIHFVYALQ